MAGSPAQAGIEDFDGRIRNQGRAPCLERARACRAARYFSHLYTAVIIALYRNTRCILQCRGCLPLRQEALQYNILTVSQYVTRHRVA